MYKFFHCLNFHILSLILEDENIDDSYQFYKMIMKSVQCFTNQVPPMLGSIKEICSGKNPKTEDEWNFFLEEEKTLLANSWSIGLAIGIVTTILITVGVTIIIAKFCCNSYMNSPKIFPCEKCKTGSNENRGTMVSPFYLSDKTKLDKITN